MLNSWEFGGNGAEGCLGPALEVLKVFPEIKTLIFTP